MKEITNTPTKTFIEKAIKVHNNKYDYTDSIYVKSTEKISIKCARNRHIIVSFG